MPDIKEYLQLIDVVEESKRWKRLEELRLFIKEYYPDVRYLQLWTDTWIRVDSDSEDSED